MKTSTIVLLVILVVLIGVLIALYFIGRRLQKQQEEQNVRIQANKQPVVIMAVDKKRLKLKESGLPEEVISSTPWYARRSKVPTSSKSRACADRSSFPTIPSRRAGGASRWTSCRRRQEPSPLSDPAGSILP